MTKEQLLEEIGELTKAAAPVTTTPVTAAALGPAASAHNASDDTDDELPQPETLLTLDREKPERAPPVIDGILREGAVGALISGSKCQKSWSAGALLHACGVGLPWFGHQVKKGPCCLIDGELTKGTIYSRMTAIADAMSLSKQHYSDVDIYALRGRTQLAWNILNRVRPNQYRLIILDPWYAFYPMENFDENSNSAVSALVELLITEAERTHAAILLIHHFSKGNQSEKQITDLGAGGGALARRVDAHLACRPHAENGAIVLDGVVRDFPPMVPTCWRWDYPRFHPATDLDPTLLRAPRARKQDAARRARAAVMPPAPEWTVESFCTECLCDQPRTMVEIEQIAKEHHLSGRAIRGWLQAAVFADLVKKLDGQGGANGRPARYCRVPAAEAADPAKV